MSFSQRISAFVTLLVLSIVAVGVVAGIALWQSEYYFRRALFANKQLAEINELNVSVQHFASYMAESMSIPEVDRATIDSSAAELDSALQKLAATTSEELVFIQSAEEREEESEDTLRLTRIGTIISQMHAIDRQIIALREQNDIQGAQALYAAEFHDKLHPQLEQEFAAAMADEEGEVSETESEAQRFWDLMLWIGIAVVLSAIAASVYLARNFQRSLNAPIKSLLLGTVAIRQGDLNYRIPVSGNDEFSQLASNFNEMAQTQEQSYNELHSSRDLLARKVEERTVELTRQSSALSNANAKLVEMDRIRVQFLADVSHELRTPLTTLRGEAQIALRPGPKPLTAYRDALERVVEQSNVLGNQIDDLLFMARTESDAVRFDWKLVDLSKIVSAAVQDGRVLAQLNSVDIRAQIGTEPIQVRADAARLKQVIVILIDNAIKYSKPGQNVDVILGNASSTAEIVVRDFGAGIRPKDLPHVFDRFYRGKASETASSSNSSKGSGLGLSIARWLVEKHLGEISIKSKPNVRTEVFVRIPVSTLPGAVPA
jgi:signal transduction histidine kinase